MTGNARRITSSFTKKAAASLRGLTGRNKSSSTAGDRHQAKVQQEQAKERASTSSSADSVQRSSATQTPSSSSTPPNNHHVNKKTNHHHHHHSSTRSGGGAGGGVSGGGGGGSGGGGGKTPGDFRIGDEIDLRAKPWTEALGVYSCKASKRPGFVKDAMDEAALILGLEPARNELAEAFLVITDTHLIEMTPQKADMLTGKLAVTLPIELLAKLKFRRQESVSLFFKAAPEDPLIYKCADSGEAVHEIQAVLKRRGVKGKHMNAAAHRSINEALQLVQEIQTKELALKHDPTVERVHEIMDLYTQTVERFESAGDMRHKEVEKHMKIFLSLSLTKSILDGTFKKLPETELPRRSTDGEVPLGEVLESNELQLLEDDMEGAISWEDVEEDKKFAATMDNLLEEARRNLDTFKKGETTTTTNGDVDDDVNAIASNSGNNGATAATTSEEKKDALEILKSSSSKDSTPKGTTTGSGLELTEDSIGLDGFAADLEDMMKEADKELAELMAS